MKEIFVDTDKLEDRMSRGTEIRDAISDDVTVLEDDIAALEDDQDLSSCLIEMKEIIDSITGVCRYDEYAWRQYLRTIEKASEIISAIE